jgi:hypothetical protein
MPNCASDSCTFARSSDGIGREGKDEEEGKNIDDKDCVNGSNDKNGSSSCILNVERGAKIQEAKFENATRLLSWSSC